jgi:hypothetical protein
MQAISKRNIMIVSSEDTKGTNGAPRGAFRRFAVVRGSFLVFANKCHPTERPLGRLCFLEIRIISCRAKYRAAKNCAAFQDEK